jgi:hypothetical protein
MRGGKEIGRLLWALSMDRGERDSIEPHHVDGQPPLHKMPLFELNNDRSGVLT